MKFPKETYVELKTISLSASYSSIRIVIILTKLIRATDLAELIHGAEFTEFGTPFRTKLGPWNLNAQLRPPGPGT